MAKKKDGNYDSDGEENLDFEAEPNFEDPEGFVDDVSDEGMYYHTYKHNMQNTFHVDDCQSFLAEFF